MSRQPTTRLPVEVHLACEGIPSIPFHSQRITLEDVLRNAKPSSMRSEVSIGLLASTNRLNYDLTSEPETCACCCWNRHFGYRALRHCRNNAIGSRTVDIEIESVAWVCELRKAQGTPAKQGNLLTNSVWLADDGLGVRAESPRKATATRMAQRVPALIFRSFLSS